MVFVVDHHMVQALPPDTANTSFHIGMLPRTLGSGQHFLYTHVLAPLPKDCSVDKDN